MLTIIFEAHGTTFDNEAHLASGLNDVDLSPLGETQARELGARYKGEHFDAIFCSDLVRSWRTAEIAFPNLVCVQPLKIIKDARLRECDYGDMTQNPSMIIDEEKPKRIARSFPNGESYEDTNKRMKNFLDDLQKNYIQGSDPLPKRVMIIGHRATQYALDYYLKGIPLEQSVSTAFKWQPGWEYCVNNKRNTEEAFLWIIDILDSNNIQYKITGGFAARIYGCTRELNDIDIEVLFDDVEKIVKKLQPYIAFGPGRFKDEKWDLRAIKLIHKEQKIDLADVEGGYYNESKNKWEFESKDNLNTFTMCNVFDRLVPVETIDELIKYKTNLARDVDIEDVRQLTEIRKSLI